MASVLLSPSPTHFNSLPDIADSDAVIQERCKKQVLSQLCNIFIKHQVHKTFGFALVHQHFDLEPDEKLVSIGNVAVPIRDGSFMDGIVATRREFDREKVVPYEFTLGAVGIDMNQHCDFLRELERMLDSYGLSKHLGLCTLDSIVGPSKGTTIEFTSGHANITLPVDVDPHNGWSIEASWQVSEGSSPGMTAFGPNTGYSKKHVNTKS